MMGQLIKEGRLASNWRCTRESGKAKNSPTLLEQPSVSHLPLDGVAGEASIRDVDGSEWRASYADKLELEDIEADFKILTDEVSKSRRGES